MLRSMEMTSKSVTFFQHLVPMSQHETSWDGVSGPEAILVPRSAKMKLVRFGRVPRVMYSGVFMYLLRSNQWGFRTEIFLRHVR